MPVSVQILSGPFFWDGKMTKAIVKRVNDGWYEQLVDDLRQLEYTGIVLTKHAIGKRILQDELKFGKPEYGSKKIQGLAKELGASWSDLYKCIQFARKFPKIVTALQNVSWRHVVQNLLPEHKDKPESPSLPEGKFRVIYSDPPWKYSDELIEGYGAATHHYPVMSITELCEMGVQNIVADNAVLFLWVTCPLLDECWPVIKAWGFTYKTNFVWDKVKHNFGHYSSVRHELLLLCTRGSCLPTSKKLNNSVVRVPRSDKHSEKPATFRQMIVEMYGRPSEKTHLELFGRKKVKGWTVYGNDPALWR